MALIGQQLIGDALRRQVDPFERALRLGNYMQGMQLNNQKLLQAREQNRQMMAEAADKIAAMNAANEATTQFAMPQQQAKLDLSRAQTRKLNVGTDLSREQYHQMMAEAADKIAAINAANEAVAQFAMPQQQAKLDLSRAQTRKLNVGTDLSREQTRKLREQNRQMDAEAADKIAAINAANKAMTQFATPEEQAKLNLSRAQARKLNTGTDLLPQQIAIQRANALTKAGMLQTSRDRFINNPLYGLGRWLSTLTAPQRDKFAEENPVLWTKLTQQGILNTEGAMVNSSQPSYSQLAVNVLNGQTQQQPTMPVEAPQRNLAQKSFNPADYQLSPNTAAALKQASGEEYRTKVLTPQTRQQIRSSATAANIYNDSTKYMPALEAYAGYSGNMQKLLDQLRASTNLDAQQQYSDFLKMQQNTVLLAGELRKLLGTSATDQESKMLNKAIMPKLLKMSPRDIIELHQSLGKTLNDVSYALKESPTQLDANLGEEFMPNGGGNGSRIIDEAIKGR